MTRTISTKDTAKLVRADLKKSFPGFKFSVRSSSYSGGSSISIRWTDGPTEAQVSAVSSGFAGASFDGMTDSMSYHNSELEGEQVRFGADFVMTSRQMSDERRAEIADSLCSFVNEIADVYDWSEVPAGTGSERDELVKVGIVRPEDSSDGKVHWSVNFVAEWAFTLVGRSFHVTSYPAPIAARAKAMKKRS